MQGQKQFTLEGKLTNEKTEPLEMANLLVVNAADSSMITYGFSDGDGEFRLLVPPSTDIVLKVSYLGYKPVEESITTGAAGESRKIKLQLEPDAELLNQVEVTEEMPIMISGDTIIYSSDAFTTGDEKKLEDVLKKLPGI